MQNVVMLTGIVEEIKPPRQYSTPIRLKVWDFARDGRRFDTTIFVDIPNEKCEGMQVGGVVSVRGKFNRRSYEKNGQKVWVNEIRVFEATCDRPGTPQGMPDGGGNHNAGRRDNNDAFAKPQTPAPGGKGSWTEEQVKPSPGFQAPSDDDIPF